MHGRAVAAPRGEWAVVEDTHEAIISQELWDTVQAQLNKNTRALQLDQNVGLFAGLLKCGDCGRSMVKTRWNEHIRYSCGSYRRYGATVCSSHYIAQDDLEAIILSDLNRVIAAAGDLAQLAEENSPGQDAHRRKQAEQKRLNAALGRVQRLGQNAYEDYRDGLLSREEFLRYKSDYERQEQTLSKQLAALGQVQPQDAPPQPWLEQLLQLGRLAELDRATLAQTVKEIRVFADKRIEIDYLFSDELRGLLEAPADATQI
jgi:hypothetical protein